MAELMREVQDLARLKSLEARLKFHVVWIPENGHGSCREFPTVDLMVEYVRALVGKPGQVFIFFAERWHLTRGPLKFLVPPNGGDRIPLFQSLDQLDIDPDGATSTESDEPEDRIS